MTCDSRLGKKLHFKRWQVTLGFCLFFFLVPGLLFSTNLGAFFLDVIDTYSASVAQAFGAGAEATAVAWIYLSHHSIEKIGRSAYILHFSSWYIGSALLGLLVSLTNPIIAFPVGISIMVIGFIAAFLLCNKTDSQGNKLSLTDRLYYLTIFQLEPLRKHFNDTACENSKWRVPYVWSILIKYATPTIVNFLFFSSLASPE